MKKLSILFLVFLVACGGRGDYRDALPRESVITVGGTFGLLGRLGIDRDGAWEVFAGGESGLSMTDNIYVFVDSMGGRGILARVADRSKLDIALGGDGSGRSVVARDGGVYVYDDHSMLYYASADASEQMSERAERLFAQRRRDGLMGDRAVAQALDGGHDMCAFIRPSWHALFLKTDVLATADLEPGRVTARVEVLFADKSAEREYLDDQASMLRRVTGKYAKYVPENPVAVIAVNIKGAEIVRRAGRFEDVFEDQPIVRTALEALDGELMVALNEIDPGEHTLLFTALAELDKPEVVMGFAALATAAGAKKTGENRYTIRAKDMDIHFGVRGKMLYATNDPRTVEALSGRRIASMDARMLRGYGAVAVDCKAIRDVSDGLYLDRVPKWVRVLDRIDLTMSDLNGVDVTLHLNDKDKNAAEVFFATLGEAWNE